MILIQLVNVKYLWDKGQIEIKDWDKQEDETESSDDGGEKDDKWHIKEEEKKLELDLTNLLVICIIDI